MPYDNEYNRNIAKKIFSLNKNLIDRLDEQYEERLGGLYNNISGSTGGSGYAKSTFRDRGDGECDGVEGLVEPVKKGGVIIPKKNVRIQPRQPKKPKIASDIQKRLNEVIEEVVPKKEESKTGSGIISSILGAIGLGKVKEPKMQKMKKVKVAGVEEYKKGMSSSKEDATGRMSSSKEDATRRKLGKLGSGITGGAIESRIIGGDKLLSKQEMPPSQMSGNGKNKWLDTVKKVKSEHPELKGVKQITQYIKDNNLYEKGVKEVKPKPDKPKKKLNKYFELQAKIRKEHPNLKTVKEIAKYIKDNNLYEK